MPAKKNKIILTVAACLFSLFSVIQARADFGGTCDPKENEFVILKTGDVRYAVSLYGIEHDTFEEGGTKGTAGLTFGPATGQSYLDTFSEHMPSGELTASGNPHRCIHRDSWEAIAHWAEVDPYVYEECIAGDGESCTKTVPLDLSDSLKDPAYGGMSGTGDGTSVLYASIKEDYRKWNREHSDAFQHADASNPDQQDSFEYLYGTTNGGWPDAAIRNTLNGVTTDAMLAVNNSENGFAEAQLSETDCLLAAFPDELQGSILPKEVVSIELQGSTVKTHDSLWLFSKREFDNDNTLIEGSVYEKRQSASDGALMDYNELYSGAGQDGGTGTKELAPALSRSVVDVSHVYPLEGGTESDPCAGYSIAPGFCIGRRPLIQTASFLLLDANGGTFDDGSTVMEYTPTDAELDEIRKISEENSNTDPSLDMPQEVPSEDEAGSPAVPDGIPAESGKGSEDNPESITETEPVMVPEDKTESMTESVSEERTTPEGEGEITPSSSGDGSADAGPGIVDSLDTGPDIPDTTEETGDPAETDLTTQEEPHV